ncbi:MAG: ribosome maturation factor RimP [candidate division WOR-3 bacterium]|nr:ribosome maturation factor RimP [candidate division WOR-3 bacterium]
MKLSDKLLSLIKETINACGVELYDVEFKGKILRVSITKPEGISLDECAYVSERLSQKLDLENLIPTRYYLEVSSPGIERKLRNVSDYQGVIGNKVSIITKSGRFVGKVQSVEASGLVILNDVGSKGKAGEAEVISFADIKSAHLVVATEDLFKEAISRMQKSSRDNFADYNELNQSEIKVDNNIGGIDE